MPAGNDSPVAVTFAAAGAARPPPLIPPPAPSSSSTRHVQGDLSAVPVASCSLNLDWDDDSNPYSVWQCSTLRQLRIVAQLPLSPGAFRPARLAALEHLAIAGCCHIPAYFAEALCSMGQVGRGKMSLPCSSAREWVGGGAALAWLFRLPASLAATHHHLRCPHSTLLRSQLTRLEMTDCLPAAVAAVPWQLVLPRLPALQAVAIERCPGATHLSTLWMGLAACPHLHHLTITGCIVGGGLPPPAPLALPCTAACCSPAVAPGFVDVPRPPCPFEQQAAEALAAAAEAPTVPDCSALLQHLRTLDLSNNGLTSLPAGLAWCQQLTRLCAAGNALRRVPSGLAALGGLRSLDLSSNQLSALQPGRYLCQLESLRLEGNMPLPPTALPMQLLQRRRLRYLSLPTWWQLVPEEAVAPMLLRLMPWLALVYC